MKIYIAPKMTVCHIITQQILLTISSSIEGSAYDAPVWEDTQTSDEALVKTAVVEWPDWE